MQASANLGGLVGEFNILNTGSYGEIVSNSVFFKPGSELTSPGLKSSLIGFYVPAANPIFHSNYVDIIALGIVPATNNYITNNTGAAIGAGSTKNFVVTGTHSQGGGNTALMARCR